MATAPVCSWHSSSSSSALRESRIQNYDAIVLVVLVLVLGQIDDSRVGSVHVQLCWMGRDATRTTRNGTHPVVALGLRPAILPTGGPSRPKHEERGKAMIILTRTTGLLLRACIDLVQSELWRVFKDNWSFPQHMFS